MNINSTNKRKQEYISK